MIYLDHNATTPTRPEVREAMLPYLGEEFGNPSSIYERGRLARNALDEARGRVAQLAGVHPSQVIFTGGGTEAGNLALRGVVLRAVAEGRLGRVLVGATEHSAVLEPAEDLAAFGIEVVKLPVDAAGRVTPETLENEISADTILVSVMAANNETGVLNDTSALAAIAREHGVTFHTDAVQVPGKLPLDFTATGANLMNLSAHKLGGPKGVGALVTDNAVDLLPLVTGGGQEGGRRAGTENLPGIVGFGVAAEIAMQEQAEHAVAMRELRDELERRLASRPGTSLFAADAERLPNTLFFGLEGMDGETVQMGLDRQGIAVSTGSACHSESTEPSHVLTAMGIPEALARGAIRVSFGRGNNMQDIDALVNALDSLASALPTGAMQGGGPVGW